MTSKRRYDSGRPFCLANAGHALPAGRNDARLSNALPFDEEARERHFLAHADGHQQMPSLARDSDDLAWKYSSTIDKRTRHAGRASIYNISASWPAPLMHHGRLRQCRIDYHIRGKSITPNFQEHRRRFPEMN